MKSRPSGSVARPSVDGPAWPGSATVAEPVPESVGALLTRSLARQLDIVLRDELTLDLDGPAVDRTGAALRRIEAQLDVFGPVFEARPAATLAAEVAWWAALLSDVLDDETLTDRITGRLAALPDALVVGPVAVGVQWVLSMEKVVHLERLAEALRSPRYQRFLRTLHEWRTATPLARRSEAGPGSAAKYVIAATDVFQGRLTAALRDHEPDQLARVRRAGQQVRYAAEVGGEHLGRKVGKRVARVRRVEVLLDELASSLQSADFLSRAGPAVGVDTDHNGFTYGLLYEQELRTAAAVRERLAESL